jgi:hypothetical protein
LVLLKQEILNRMTSNILIFIGRFPVRCAVDGEVKTSHACSLVDCFSVTNWTADGIGHRMALR